ncbi:hypothetical protein WN51_13196 [Melipona quadrifasciata]|uniref:Dachshund like protein 1 n=1 Tax=Melipona quadrifasciata TaxID=166423 RepID=A0A0M9A2W2_9HYME|nr:hypothetical protein WN51_13196 [Melipona quadrifasciata]
MNLCRIIDSQSLQSYIPVIDDAMAAGLEKERVLQVPGMVNITSKLMYQKRLKKERRARKRLQEQLDLEIKRRTQLEEALKATGASPEQVRAITENVTVEARTSSEPPEASPVHSQSQQQPSQQQSSQQPLQQQQQAQQYREAQVPRPSQQPSTPEKPAWGYGLDLIGSQASAFWQNYQESLVQELELERKSRQHQAAERDQVKSPLQVIVN